MRCIFCNTEDTQVRNSRPSDDGMSIRRRRWCSNCNSRFTTFERVQIREFMVIKNNGDRKIFDPNKITSSINMATRKRNISSEKIDEIVNNIVKHLEGQGESEIPTKLIGELIMNELKKLDQVSYVRFASVYKQFREAQDFDNLIKELNINKD
jgi:transcriptional repressor NrdR